MKEIQISLVTIGIPVYNEEKYLAKTIESAINQTYKNIRILISDNCSTDNSFKIAKEYEAIDSRIKVFKQHENIATGNFEFLLNNAETEYFCFLGGHDILKANFIEEALNIFNSDNKVVGVYPKVEYFKTDLIKTFDSGADKGTIQDVKYTELEIILKDNWGDNFSTLNLNTYESFRNIMAGILGGNSFYGLYKRDIMLISFFNDKPIGFGDLGAALRTSSFGYIVPTSEVCSYFRITRPLETAEQLNKRYKSYNFPDNWRIVHSTYPFRLINQNKLLSFNEKIKLNVEFQREIRKFYPLKWGTLIGYYFNGSEKNITVLLLISFWGYFFGKIKRTVKKIWSGKRT